VEGLDGLGMSCLSAAALCCVASRSLTDFHPPPPPPPPPLLLPHGQQDGGDFDHPYERKRRRQLALLFTRSKEEELEEYRLREELKTIDAALKKAKRHPVKSQVRAPEEAREAVVTEVIGGQPQKMRLVSEKQAQDPRPEPRPGHPYLQSARLTVPMAAPRLQKGMLLKVKQLLADLGLPPRPLPTKVRACVCVLAGVRTGGV
jgi:hypothetical protein